MRIVVLKLFIHHDCIMIMEKLSERVVQNACDCTRVNDCTYFQDCVVIEYAQNLLDNFD